MNDSLSVRILGLALSAAVLLAPVVATADRHGGPYGPGPRYYGGPGHAYGGYRGGYHSSFGLYFYPQAYYGSYGYYGSPYYYPPETVIYDAGPRVVYESAPPASAAAQPPAAYWYYCESNRTYFPYAQECPSGWQAVPAPPPPTSQQSRQPAPAPAGRVTYRLGDVLFATGQSILRAGATSTLDSMLASIRGEPNGPIVIEGHTDAQGGDADNLRLSQSRAEAVKRYLVEHGVPSNRVTALGKGEAGAIANNATAEGRQQNRRVDIIVG